MDVAESWPVGTQILTPHTVAGYAPILAAVGGINSGLSFGLGVWNMMIYGIDMLDGADMTSAKYTTGGTAQATWHTMTFATTSSGSAKGYSSNKIPGVGGS